MKRLLVCLGALVALAVGTSRAEAFPITINDGDSYTAVFDVYSTGDPCSTCGVEATFALSGGTLTISVTNTSTDLNAAWNVLTQFGFFSTPNLTAANGGTLSDGFATGWALSYNDPGGGLGGTWEVLADTTKGQNNALTQGNTGTITFTGLGASITLDDALVHIQKVGANGGSTKFTCCTEGEGEGQNEAEGQGPEPASLLLFGMALSAAGIRMRRARA